MCENGVSQNAERKWRYNYDFFSRENDVSKIYLKWQNRCTPISSVH